MEDLKQLLITLHRQYPNDMEFGGKIRSILWKMMEEQSRSIKEEQLPGQLNIFSNE